MSHYDQAVQVAEEAVQTFRATTGGDPEPGLVRIRNGTYPFLPSQEGMQDNSARALVLAWYQLFATKELAKAIGPWRRVMTRVSGLSAMKKAAMALVTLWMAFSGMAAPSQAQQLRLAPVAPTMAECHALSAANNHDVVLPLQKAVSACMRQPPQWGPGYWDHCPYWMAASLVSMR